MSAFRLRIVTPDGLMFDGEAHSVAARTVNGDAGILAGHANYITLLSKGTLKLTTENGDAKFAECSNGILSVKNGEVRIITDTFEWKDFLPRS